MKKSKKILALCLAAVLVLSFTSCAGNRKPVIEESSVSDSELSSTADAGETTDTSFETEAGTTAQASTDSLSTTAAPATKATAKTPQNIKDTAGIKHDIGSEVGSATGNAGNVPVTEVKTIDTKTASDVQQKLYSTYKNAKEKTNALSSYDYDISMQVNASGNGQSFSENVTGNIKMVKNGTDIKILCRENIQGSDLICYYTDGTLYLSSGGNKQKYSMDLSTFESAAQVSVPSSTKSLLEEDFEYAKTSSSDGSTTITLNIKPESLTKLFGTAFSSAGDSIDFSNASLKFVINKDGYLSNYVVECNAKMTVNQNGKQTAMNLYMSYKMVLNHPGQSVTITPPSDLNTYQ